MKKKKKTKKTRRWCVARCWSDERDKPKNETFTLACQCTDAGEELRLNAFHFITELHLDTSGCREPR